jgi:hypothetical protein
MDNVSSWIFGVRDQEENTPATDSSESVKPPAEDEVRLDPEEVRRRRLNNMDTSIKLPLDTSSNSILSSPKRANTTIEHTPQDKKKTRPPGSPLHVNDPPSSTSSSPALRTTPSGGAKLDRYARTLNLTLEYIFQITVRFDNARANIKFMDTEGDSDFLNVDNLEYLLPMRLMEVVQEGATGTQQGATCYLIRTYKRLLEKESQALSEDPALKDLQRYSSDIIIVTLCYY